MPVKPKKRFTFSSIGFSVSIVSIISLAVVTWWRTTDSAVAQGRLDQKQDGEIVRVEQKVDAHIVTYRQDIQAIQVSVKELSSVIKSNEGASQQRHGELMKIMLDRRTP